MKRLSLFLVLALALSAMLIACGKKDESGAAKGCTQDWLNVFPEGKENAKIFQITQMNSVAKMQGTTQAFVAAGNESCAGFEDDKNRTDALIPDCSGDGKGFNGQYHAIFTPVNNSVVAVYREGNDKLHIITKLEMDNDGSSSQIYSKAIQATQGADNYQYTQFNPIDITDTVVEGTCDYHLSGSVSITAFNKLDMEDSTGLPKTAGTAYPNTKVDFYYNFDTGKMEIVSSIIGKQVKKPVEMNVDADTTIKAVNIKPEGATAENKMVNTVN